MGRNGIFEYRFPKLGRAPYHSYSPFNRQSFDGNLPRRLACRLACAALRARACLLVRMLARTLIACRLLYSRPQEVMLRHCAPPLGQFSFQAAQGPGPPVHACTVLSPRVRTVPVSARRACVASRLCNALQHAIIHGTILFYPPCPPFYGMGVLVLVLVSSPPHSPHVSWLAAA